MVYTGAVEPQRGVGWTRHHCTRPSLKALQLFILTIEWRTASDSGSLSLRLQKRGHFAQFISSWRAGRVRLFKADAGAPRGLLGAPRQTEQMLPVVHAAVGGCSRLLGPGLLLILNDKLVGRIHLANVDLEAKRTQRSGTQLRELRKLRKSISRALVQTHIVLEAVLRPECSHGFASAPSWHRTPHTSSPALGTVGGSHSRLLAPGTVPVAAYPEPVRTRLPCARRLRTHRISRPQDRFFRQDGVLL